MSFSCAGEETSFQLYNNSHPLNLLQRGSSQAVNRCCCSLCLKTSFSISDQVQFFSRSSKLSFHHIPNLLFWHKNVTKKQLFVSLPHSTMSSKNVSVHTIPSIQHSIVMLVLRRIKKEPLSPDLVKFPLPHLMPCP